MTQKTIMTLREIATMLDTREVLTKELTTKMFDCAFHLTDLAETRLRETATAELLQFLKYRGLRASAGRIE